MKRKRDKRRQIIASIIAIVIILMMVLSMLSVMVSAEESEAASTSTSSEEMQEDAAGEAVELEESEDGAALTADSSMKAETVADSTQTTIPSSARTERENCRVYVDNIDVTNMTEEQIQKAIDARIEELKQCTIVMYAGSGEVNTTAGDLGLTYTNTYLASEAYSIARKGNIVKRFKADRFINENGPIVLDLAFTIDEEAATTIISRNVPRLNCAARSNGLKLRKDNVFVMTEGKDGVAVDTPASARKVREYIENEWHGGQGGVILAATITPYDDQSENLTKVDDLLGTCTTAYGTGNINHDTNVEIAAEKINGAVLYPGEELSAEKTIGPTTEENGFLPGNTYVGSKVIETYGGGVCQVTTTLYGAVLEAELEVTERHNHSSLVSYVEPGMDAAISEGLLDFKFVNNTQVPIYIQAVMEGGYLTFNIYGDDTRPAGRTISFDSRVIDTTPVKTAYDTDGSKPYGTVTTFGGVQGTTAELYKIIYMNGEKQSEELVNNSIYQMMPLTYSYGTMDASPDQLTTVLQQVAEAQSMVE